MKKILILFCIVSIRLFAVEYNEYTGQTVQSFTGSTFRDIDGADVTLINMDQFYSASGPALFTYNNTLFLADRADWESKRTLQLKSNYEVEKKYDGAFYSFFNPIVIDDYILACGVDDIEILRTTDMSIISRLTWYDFEFLKYFKDIYFQDNTLFIFDENFKLWAIKDPGLDNDKNRRNIIKEADVIKNIKSGLYKGLTIDNKKRFFFNDKIQTMNFSVFYEYMKATFQNNQEPPKVLFTMNLEDLEINECNYMSIDTDGNTYWRVGYAGVAVLNNNGVLIDLFAIDNSDLSPVVTDSGDIYFLKYHEDSVDLNKIERHW